MEQQHLSQEEMPASTEARTAYSTQTALEDEAVSDASAREEATVSAEPASRAALLQQQARSRRKEEWTTLAWAGAILGWALWIATRSFSDVPDLMNNLGFFLMMMGAMGAGMFLQIRRLSRRRK